MFRSPSQQPRKQVVKAYSSPAPVRGMNSRDPLAATEETFALNLTNLICTAQGVTARKGSRAHATGFTSPVETIMSYKGQTTANDKFFAASGGEVFDISTPGAIGSAVVSSLTSSLLSYVNFTGSAGNYLVFCNGQVAPRHWDGSSWVTWTTVGSPAVPGETSGVTLTELAFVTSHQRRLWFIQKNSDIGWYFPVNSLGGAATAFTFGPMFKRGGKLLSLTSWSTDGGTGMQNNLLAVSDRGDLVIYEGTDPSDSTKWRLAGTWTLAAPVNDRCFLQVGSEMFYLSQEGMMPLSQYMSSGTSNAAITDVIKPTIKAIVAAQAGLDGFQLHRTYDSSLILINVPQIDEARNYQVVLNTSTAGWSVFSGFPALCWETHTSSDYFGSTDAVYKAFTGYKDSVAVDGTGGDTYTAMAQQAFVYFNDDRNRNKRFTMVRPVLLSAAADPAIAVSIATDFRPPSVPSISAPTTTSETTWDGSNWNEATWAAGANISLPWTSVSGVGYSANINISFLVQAETTWVATDWMYEPGGLFG